jgi:hypothetical protein
MSKIKSYEAVYKKNKKTYITNKNGKSLLRFDVEEQQCTNDKCKDYGVVKYIKVDESKEIDKSSFEII